jgi:hypothetical protein
MAPRRLGRRRRHGVGADVLHNSLRVGAGHVLDDLDAGDDVELPNERLEGGARAAALAHVGTYLADRVL